MATRLKGNKGYFSLLAGETLYSSVQLGLSLALINLPMAIVCAALDFSANVAGGIIMGPKTARLPAEASGTPAPKKSAFQTVKSFAKKMAIYNASCFLDPEYTVGASAASAGMAFFFQGALGIHSVLASHSITVVTGFLSITGVSLPLGLGLCGAMLGLGLAAIVTGNMDKWKGISKYFHKVFLNEAPPAESPTLFKKFAEHPLISKIVNNPAAKVLKKTLLVGMTVEASLFAITNFSSVIYQRSATLLASPAKAAVSTIAPITWAGVCCWRATWQLISAGRLTLRNMLGKKPKQKTAASETVNTASATLQPAAGLKAALPEHALTDTFKAVNQNNTPSPAKTAPARPQQKPATP